MNTERPDEPERPEAEPPEETAADDRRARRPSPVVVLSVAAAVLLVGGGGAYLATTADEDGADGRTGASAGGAGTPPPLVLDGYAGRGATGPANGVAPGEPDPHGMTYRARGPLPGGPGSAAVYRPAGDVTRAEVTRLADALGVHGTPVTDGPVWRVGPEKDGAGPVLRVNRQAPGSWTFERYAPGTDDCRKVAVCPRTPADPVADPVSPAAARKAAAPVLAALGQGNATLDTGQVMGARRVVNADPVVGGLPTYGWSTGLSVDRQGEVVDGNGLLKVPVKTDTYPVLSAARTLELMNAAPRADHRMGIGGCASPVPLKDRFEQPCGSPKASAAPGTATVEKAVFGLASRSAGGRQTLVPSWLFDVRAPGAGDAFTVTYPALDPKYLAPAGTPADPAPTPTGTAPTGSAPTGKPTTRDVRPSGYTAEGDELTVSFTGGVCSEYRTKAVEKGDRVEVTVTETSWPDKVCILIAKEYRQTVRLDEPLGARKVVGPDGKGLTLTKPGARLPGSAPSLAR
ncbi:hypothetical protein AB0F77_17760 [Streptomyces sp. NPDC026672]|uniref:hypothetical protein n=1 Tax=unclassified Streptomyces TaxID=2593676 RepID=UPI0033E97C7D